jgi:hypothetical protein
MKAHSVGREAVLGRRSGACARGRPLPDQVLESGRFWVKADLSSGSTAKDLQRLTLNGPLKLAASAEEREESPD